MDRVLLGRVLGKGARLAARTAMEALDAATTEPPTGSSRRYIAQPSASTNTRLSAVRPQVLAPSQLGSAARTAQSSFATPLRKASRALWHELTGSFFALFAFSFCVGVWRNRVGAWSHVSAERNRLAAFCLLALLFLYFSISSFLKARKQI